jgi:hypothetical protein
MNLSDGVVGCDYCETTSKDKGRVIYECDKCGADVCSACSSDDGEDSMVVLCDPDQSAHPGVRCFLDARP